MAKFGEIISSSSPTLIDFFNATNEDENVMQNVLTNVASALGNKAKVIKIDISKNSTLVDALRIKGTPTFIIYKNSEMKWRQSGKQNADTLINLVEQFI